MAASRPSLPAASRPRTSSPQAPRLRSPRISIWAVFARVAPSTSAASAPIPGPTDDAAIACPWCGVRDEADFAIAATRLAAPSRPRCRPRRLPRLCLRARQSAWLAPGMVASRPWLSPRAKNRSPYGDAPDRRSRTAAGRTCPCRRTTSDERVSPCRRRPHRSRRRPALHLGWTRLSTAMAATRSPPPCSPTACGWLGAVSNIIARAAS